MYPEYIEMPINQEKEIICHYKWVKDIQYLGTSQDKIFKYNYELYNSITQFNYIWHNYEKLLDLISHMEIKIKTAMRCHHTSL